MERYRVSRKQEIVAFVVGALEASGFTVEHVPDGKTAPFIFSVLTPWNEPLELICYLFLANKYDQQGRPEDEHRFQVKYGSDFKRPHELFIATDSKRLTLMFGVHLDAGVIVAVDPAMHNPTWFSRSVEFKSGQVELTKRSGWVGWERERSRARRRVMPQENCQTEVLLGLRPERFADYVMLERQCTGIPPGERLWAIETKQLHVDELHGLELMLDLSRHEIMDAINARKRLLVAVRGAAAELHLRRLLRAEGSLSRVTELDEDGQPDFEIEYGGRPFRIECKNTLRRLRGGLPKVDFQKTRSSKSDPCSRYYRPEQFEILAACLHPITDRWEFRFCPTAALAPHSKCEGHLSPHVLVQNGGWTASITEAVDAAVG